MESDKHTNAELSGTSSSVETKADEDKDKKSRRFRVGSRLREVFVGKEEVVVAPARPPESSGRGIALADFLITQQAAERRRAQETTDSTETSKSSSEEDDDEDENENENENDETGVKATKLPQQQPTLVPRQRTESKLFVADEAESAAEQSKALEDTEIIVPEPVVVEAHEINLASSDEGELPLSPPEAEMPAVPVATSEGLLQVSHDESDPIADTEADDVYTMVAGTSSIPPRQAGGGSNQPPVPPRESLAADGYPEEPDAGLPAAIPRPYFPGSFAGGGAPHVAALETTPAALRAVAGEAEDAVYLAERQGVRRGLLAGLVVGGVIEHVRHKSREKRTATQTKRQFERQGDQLTAASRRHTELEDQMARYRAENRTMRRELEDRRQDTIRIGNREIPLQVAERTSQTVAERQTGRTPEAGRAAEHYPADAVAAAAAAEAVLSDGQTPPDVIPENTRIESSAWHRIEVDKNTGKVIENPTLAYGEAFLGEQAKETNTRRSSVQKGGASTGADSAKNQSPSGAAALPTMGNAANDDDSGGSFEQRVSSLIQGAKAVNDKVAKQIEKVAPASLTGAAKDGDAQQVDMWLWVVLGVVFLAIVTVLLV